MKKYILTLIGCALFFYSQAQTKPETVKKKNRLTDNVKEKFTVLKSDNSTREGLYEAVYSGTGAVIARGNYANGKKVGIWHFFDVHQKLVEAFNYNTNSLLAEEQVDDYSRQYIIYSFDKKARDTDRLTKPLRIGGRCYGYIPYLQIFRLSMDYRDVDTRLLNGMLELLISPGGRLADVKVHIMFPGYPEQVTTFSPDIFSEEDKQFVPATLNGKPILSRIFLACKVNYSGRLDVD